MRESRDELAAIWLERLLDRVTLPPDRVFPTERLLDHMPYIVAGVADFLESPARAIALDTPVLAYAMELGALRHSQGFDESEILKEYEIFGGILFGFVSRCVAELEIDQECENSELVVCMHRLFTAIQVLQQATTMHYLGLMRDKLREREEQLYSFNRALTHEFRNKIGAALGAGQVLQIPGLPAESRNELASVVVRNLDAMRGVLESLLELTRMDLNRRQHRNVLLADAAAEAARQLRDAAAAAGVAVRIADDIPPVEVHAAAVELCLTNLIGNAIKYADRDKPSRWVRVEARLEDGERPGRVVVEVRDNGVGVPPERRNHLFERFYRAHDAGDLEGTGLGLSIVRETVEALGGRAWAEFDDEGSVFAFALPARREDDPSPTS
jgi:signal transduction histidine kinase